MCKYKGKSEDACQNYIKVLAKLGDDRVLVCGTNAFKPKCRSYIYGPVSRVPCTLLAPCSLDSWLLPSIMQMHNYLVHGEKSGEALCPYDPSYSSTATFAPTRSDDANGKRAHLGHSLFPH